LSDEALKEFEDNLKNPKSTASSKIVSQLTLDLQREARAKKGE
jgi:hypothetical protein